MTGYIRDGNEEMQKQFINYNYCALQMQARILHFNGCGPNLEHCNATL